ncbi:gamma-tubulin complex component 3 homolog [Microplitis demolitor]|uniref:gamma-tubulin complex component 3 homolog n=1 Tax=Microplitis demolitor TaxID=69319 RepID=UPI0004CCAECE|nr:gamma-tubulin complex component 3 homolog [Microplitis demolitor]
MSVNEAETVADLVQKLIISVCGQQQKSEVIRRLMRISLGILSSAQGVDSFGQDEITTANEIKSKLSSRDCNHFDKLHNDIKDKSLKNKVGILIFLLNMSNQTNQVKDKYSFHDMRLGLSLAPSTSVDRQSNSQEQIVSLNTQNYSSCAEKTTRENNSSKIFINQHNISESVLVQDLIYSFQGIEGKILKLDSNYGFQLDSSVEINRSHKQSVLRLSELGYLHNVVRKGLERMSMAGAGRVADSFVASFHKELSEYYRFIAIIQEQVNRTNSNNNNNNNNKNNSNSNYSSSSNSNCMGGIDCGETVTLSHLHLWAFDPLENFKWLGIIVRACQNEKGGALASAVYEFSHHGDPKVKKLVNRILSSVCEPLYNMLIRWINDGELDDPFQEFFIEARTDVMGDRMWHEKYHVRDNMLPTFIPKSQAKKILGTGKSINFLRQVCKDSTAIYSRHADMLIDDTDKSNVEAFFNMDPDGPLQMMMDAAYKENSTRVVEMLTKQCQLIDHLQGIKGYLLLGQGHFIQHLMHLIEPELAKPANSLYPHNLSSILETAIRATCTKAEDLDVQRRLDVRLLTPSDKETGWDVFILDYNVDGPIGTILEPCRQTYRTVFFSLWRAKRMESILSTIWKHQITSAKILRKMPEILPIQNHIHLITSSMVHLVHQMQYYFLFEVIECSWEVFAKNLRQAASLDDIIIAHNNFVESVRHGTLLDENSQELMNHLRSVYGPILDLENLEETFLARATQEYEARVSSNKFIEITSEKTKSWGKTNSIDAESTERQNAFTKYLTTLSRQLRVLSRTYQDRVKKFLLMLASAEDVSLQLLSVRLDFNEHYKSEDSSLVAPLTYQHRRQGEKSFSASK